MNSIEMKINYLYLLTFLLIFTSCGSFKKGLIQTGGQKEAIQNAILDLLNTSGSYKKDSVFSVRVYEPLHKMLLEETNDGNGRWVEGEPYKEIIAVSISTDYHKILLTDNTKVGDKAVKVPTRYMEKDGKLFYWRDEDYPLTQEALTVFKKYNLLAENTIDGVVEFYDFKINDAQKGVDYYFCKNDLTNYKKIITNKGIGYYDVPNINCNSH